MTRPEQLLRFGHGNAKLPSSTMTFALPAGHTCPGALHCLSMVDPRTGRLRDGQHTLFRCSAASEEVRPSVRDARWHNWRLIQAQTDGDLVDLLDLSLRAQIRAYTERVRWFTAGDCASRDLRDALVAIARRHQHLLFYLYSKNLPLWIEGERPLQLPDNLRLTASWGGRYDHFLQAGLFLRTARVVNTQEEAYALGLPVDYSDALAYSATPQHFAHLVHGTQPKGSEAGRAIQARRSAGLFSGYSHKRPVRPLTTASPCVLTSPSPP